MGCKSPKTLTLFELAYIFKFRDPSIGMIFNNNEDVQSVGKFIEFLLV